MMRRFETRMLILDDEMGRFRQVAFATEIAVEPGDVLLRCDRARCEGGADDRVYVVAGRVWAQSPVCMSASRVGTGRPTPPVDGR